MRGVAAIAAFGFHADYNQHGYLAVDLFFVLSGFVLAHAYKLPTWRDSARFMVARAIRLYPMIVAGAAIGLMINGGSLGTLLLVPERTKINGLFPANLALWSMLFELAASAAFAFFYRFGRVALILFALWGAAGLALGIYIYGWAQFGATWQTWQLGLCRTAFSFTVGVAIYHLRPKRQTVSPWAYAIVAVPFVIAWLPISPWLDAVLIYLLFPVLVWLGAIIETPNTRLAAAAGAISYPLYAIHYPIVTHYPLAAPWVIVAAWLFAIYYDAPVRAWLTSRFNQRQRNDAPQVT